MGNFTDFQRIIRSIGGVWNSENVYFSQTRDSYVAAFKPQYPTSTQQDMLIQTIDRSGAYQLGDFEFIRYYPELKKCMSQYFRTFQQMKDFLIEAQSC